MTYTPRRGTISASALLSSSLRLCHPTYIRLDPSLWATHATVCIAKGYGQPAMLLRVSTRRSLRPVDKEYVDALYDV